ncbi:hypothetical protein [Pelagicoccus sp. SDUM812005]|uniref:hypothetical protein n=1 Tax=Pelagicoccus sp. SDUM812005 TaxID=3041257 RepID=UPI00280FDD7D|nr:hypothetical protein [Pelagicoccus sp. SDUM812005]MDQ8183465.1 hypothetical protein [Pelagicoccus sp. SDUM812005]
MRSLIAFLAVGVAACCSSAWAETAKVGDFQTLENWSGLSPTSEQAPDGELAARLSIPGKADFEYTEAKTYSSGETVHFSDMLDAVRVEDWYDYRYLEFQVKLPNEQPLELECTLYPLKVGRPDYVDSLSSKLTVQGSGWQTVVFSLRDFDYLRHQGTFWKYIQSVSLSASGDADSILVSQPRLKKSKRVAISASVKSKPAKVGETVSYELLLENETGQTRNVTLSLENTGWEACPTELSATKLSLAPWESRSLEMTVEMNELVAPGGRERRTVTVIPDGRGDLKEELSLITVRKLPHPYLIHTEEGWEKVKQKAATVEWAKEAKQEYLDTAKRWRVPSPRTSGDYSYNHTVAQDALRCAIAWKLSGDEELARKVTRFLREFADSETGYPTTNRVSGAFVHRGNFFLNLARAYDLMYDHPSLSAQDHANMEHAMRLFSRWADYMLTTGDGNNHQDGMAVGALLNGLVMQDFAEVERYLYGTGGILDLVGQGILDDGHYFEGTINYNLLTGDIFNAAAIGLEPWGLNLKDWKVPAKYGKHIMVSPWALSGEFLGMSFERQGPSTRSYRGLKDIWDAVIPMADWRGVVFASADSGGKDLTDGSNNKPGLGYDLAYYLWRDPAYVPLLKIMENRDLLYGVADLPEVDGELGAASYVSDNVGFAVLRSNAEEPRERYQVVQRYGTHGGYHGHFDKTSLLSLSRYGRSHYNTEASWYGYWSFMFKMWVQASDSHNMTVVDHRMQKPADDRRILFHDGELMKVSATEIETVWIDPPYGGQTPYALKMPEEKSWEEARWLPTPKNPRPQGDTGTPSEPILQRRLIVVTNDYVVMADFLKGEQEHDFDNLFNSKGLVNLAAEEKVFLKHTPQADPDPYSSAQFITNCDWYSTTGTVQASFVLDWSKGEMGGRQSHSEPGVMNLDYYSLWPKQAEVMVGNYPESLNVARHLYYKVIGDGKILDEGKLAPWILGKIDIDVDVKNVDTLEIETRVEKARDAKTIFLGSPVLVTAGGKQTAITVEAVELQNIAPAASPNKDYAGGKVSIFGEDYARSLAAEPESRREPGRIRIDLRGKNASRFQATLGGDYPVGGDDIHRKIIATRSSGTEARFLSLVELHEDDSVIKSVRALSATKLVVEKTNGQTDTIEITGLDGEGDALVSMTVEENGRVIASERANP